MNKLNLAFRETLIILLPGYVFAKILFLIIVPFFEKEIIILLSLEFVFAMLFGSIFYSLDLAKKMPWFQKELPRNVAKKELEKDYGKSDYFKFYDSELVSEQFRAKDNIYTSIYHMFFNLSALVLLLLIIRIVINYCKPDIDASHQTIVILGILIFSSINTWLIFRNKVKPSFIRIAADYVSHKRNLKNVQ